MLRGHPQIRWLDVAQTPSAPVNEISKPIPSKGAMTVAKITKRSVDQIGKGEVVWDSDVKGFGVRRQTTDGVFYLLRYRHNGKQSFYSIGRHGSPWAPETARREAQRLLGWVADGRDPLAERQTERHAKPETTFGDEVDRYLAKREGEVRPFTFSGLKAVLREYCKPLHSLGLAEIDRRQIAVLLNDIEKERGPVSRNRARSTLSAFCNWLCKEGLIETNPVTNTVKVKEFERERVLSDDEVREVWGSLKGQFGDIVRLLLLTGQRRAEIGGLAWSEVSLAEGGLISFPSERMKNGEEHKLPLSAQAKAILERQRRRNDRDFVFGFGVRGFAAWSTAKANLDEAILANRQAINPKAKPMPHWTLHDLRRTFSTRLHELGVQPHIVEACLCHISGHKGGVAGRYNHAQYLGPMREALELWSDRVDAITA